MDWDRVGEVALACFSQGWSFVAVALVVYYLGQTVKRIADRKGWRAEHASEASWFDATLPIQPVVVGALLMQIPFPVWEAIDSIGKVDGAWAEAAARGAYGALCGALCGQVFEIVQSLFRFGRKKLGISADGRATPVVELPKMVPSSTVSVVVPISERPTEPEPEDGPPDGAR